MVPRAVWKVFTIPIYVGIAIVVACAVFLFAMWLPNLGTIGQILFSSTTSFSEKIIFPVSLIGSIFTNFTVFSAIAISAIAILFGIDVAMVLFFFKRRKERMPGSGAATGMLGILSGLLGIGCLSCGTLVFGTLLAWGGVGASLGLLPFGGAEFGLLGIALLLTSIALVAKKIEDPAICNVDYRV